MPADTSAKMPWLRDEQKFPRPDEAGFDDFGFTPEQIAVIADEAREEGVNLIACGIIGELTKANITDKRDFLKAVRAVVNAVF